LWGIGPYNTKVENGLYNITFTLKSKDKHMGNSSLKKTLQGKNQKQKFDILSHSEYHKSRCISLLTLWQVYKFVTSSKMEVQVSFFQGIFVHLSNCNYLLILAMMSTLNIGLI